MHKPKSIVINTGPIIALVAALGDLSILKRLYKDVLVPIQTLDIGEASVVQLAVQKNISVVCIDEAVGRRVARLNGLKLTGSIGILIRAKKEGFPIVISDVIQRMKSHGIWLSEGVISFALEQAGEGN